MQKYFNPQNSSHAQIQLLQVKYSHGVNFTLKGYPWGLLIIFISLSYVSISFHHWPIMYQEKGPNQREKLVT